jgi:hypothetical protein
LILCEASRVPRSKRLPVLRNLPAHQNGTPSYKSVPLTSLEPTDRATPYWPSELRSAAKQYDKRHQPHTYRNPPRSFLSSQLAHLTTPMSECLPLVATMYTWRLSGSMCSIVPSETEPPKSHHLPKNHHTCLSPFRRRITRPFYRFGVATTRN